MMNTWKGDTTSFHLTMLLFFLCSMPAEIIIIEVRHHTSARELYFIHKIIFGLSAAAS